MNQKEARIIGHIESDGSISNKAVRYFNTNKNLIENFKETFKQVFGYNCWKTYKNRTSFETGSGKKEAVKKVNELLSEKNDLIWDKNSSREYISAVFDDEATIILAKKKNGWDREIKMWSLNKEKLDFISTLLKKHFQINSKIYGPRKEKYFELKIMRKDDIRRFFKDIKLKHSEKIKKQKNLLKSLNHFSDTERS